MSERLTYALVTPARNEGGALRNLAGAVLAQTLTPTEWVIVDNGSTDDTARVADSLRAQAPWIHAVFVPGEPTAVRGAPVVRAFLAGLDALAHQSDVVVKLDADVTFDSSYFDNLIAAFEDDPCLGIASGTCYELERGEWVPRHVTTSRVRGATRAYRRACLEQVAPIEARSGWDGIDELKASVRGWRTRSLPNLPFYHHRRVGARDTSRVAGYIRLGAANHYMGYRPTYVAARTLFRLPRDPAAIGLVVGYVAAAARRDPKLADARARELLRHEQRLRSLRVRAREARGRATSSAS